VGVTLLLLVVQAVVGLVVALRKHRSVRGMPGAMADDALGVALLAVPSAEDSTNPTTAAASPLPQRSYPDGRTAPSNPLQRITNPPAGGGQVLDRRLGGTICLNCTSATSKKNPRL
jgi:hypothetical protein